MLGLDFYPTMLELAGIEPKDDQVMDGESLVGLLDGSAESLDRERVFWHFPCYIGGGGPSSAMRAGDWKVLEFFEGARVELYNLAEDPGEENDLFGKMKSKGEEMYAALQDWQRETGAALVREKNPNYWDL